MLKCWISFIYSYFTLIACAVTVKNHKNIGFLSNTGPDLLENHKATKPPFNVWPLNGVSLMGR